MNRKLNPLPIIPRKIAPLTDSERIELRKINKAYGKQKEFCERADITYPTFRNLLRCGYGLETTVARVRIALNPVAASKETVMDAIKVALPASDEDFSKDGSEARRITAYLLSEETTMSLTSIAKELHYKDHTAVIRANRSVENEMDVNKELRGKVERCRRAIIRKPSND